MIVSYTLVHDHSSHFKQVMEFSAFEDHYEFTLPVEIDSRRAVKRNEVYNFQVWNEGDNTPLWEGD